MKLFKKTTEKKCNFESSTNDCNLVQKLKELQNQKREIDRQIADYESLRPSCVSKFIDFLKLLEKNGVEMSSYGRYSYGRYSEITLNFEHGAYGMNKLERSLQSFELDDIDAFCDELKAFKQKSTIVSEKRAESERLAAEIKKIKDTLGIE